MSFRRRPALKSGGHSANSRIEEALRASVANHHTIVGNDFHSIAFTPAVQAVQETQGSRKVYAMQDTLDKARGRHERIGDEVAAFIAARESFYLASVSETGWPYIQHRGGPSGFLRAIDDRTLGFADFNGNRQYVSVGNVNGDDRVCLFLMDYEGRARLKILGHARISEDPETMQRLAFPEYPVRVERAWIIEVAGYDWNCSKHITPRYTEATMRRAIDPLRARIAELEAEVERLKNG